MRDPAASPLNWLSDILARRMRWAVIGTVVFVGLVVASAGLSWTSAIVTILVAVFLTTFLLLAGTFRRVFSGLSEREKP